MKLRTSFLTLLAFVIGISVANAQNQPTTDVAPPPNSINKGSTTKPSGSEAQSAAHNASARVIGSGKFCSKTRAGTLHCRYSSMSACEKSSRHGNLHCVSRPS